MSYTNGQYVSPDWANDNAPPINAQNMLDIGQALEHAPQKWDAAFIYAAGAYCIHNGYLWHNTSGASTTGVEPGTNYNVWNVTYSNENLIDNGWFTVNQRGVSDGSYNGEYTLDRFIAASDWGERCKTNIVVNENNIYLSGTPIAEYPESYAGFCQKFEDEMLNNLNGKIVTLSIYLESSSPSDHGDYADLSLKGSSYIRVYGSGITLNNIGISAKTFTWNDSFKGIFIALISGENVSSSITVRAIKLELGAVSTLANDTAPNYAEELAKCQRYYFSGRCRYVDSGNATGFLSASLFPVEMRTVPTISLSNIRNIASADITTGYSIGGASKILYGYIIFSNAISTAPYNVLSADVKATADL